MIQLTLSLSYAKNMLDKQKSTHTVTKQLPIDGNGMHSASLLLPPPNEIIIMVAARK
jgi:hypothetical protein